MLTISVDDERMQALIAHWVREKDKPIEAAVTSAARTMCKAFMQYTLPRDNRKTESRVRGDIYRVYATPGMVYEDIKNRNEGAADAFWYFIEAKKFNTARKIMAAESPKYGNLPLSPFDGGALHGRMRGARGHIHKSATPKFVVRERGLKSKLSAYIEDKVNNVGMAKAGWVAAWRDLGRVRDVPEWVSRKRRGQGTFGSAEKHFAKDKASIVIHNRVRHAEPSIDDRYRDWIESAAKARLIEYFQRQLGIHDPTKWQNP